MCAHLRINFLSVVNSKRFFYQGQFCIFSLVCESSIFLVPAHSRSEAGCQVPKNATEEMALMMQAMNAAK